MQNKEDNDLQYDDDEKPPVFSSWKGWYKLLIISLIAWIIILYLFTTFYS